MFLHNNTLPANFRLLNKGQNGEFIREGNFLGKVFFFQKIFIKIVDNKALYRKKMCLPLNDLKFLSGMTMRVSYANFLLRMFSYSWLRFKKNRRNVLRKVILQNYWYENA